MSRRVEVILTCDACMAWHDVETTEGVAEVSVSGQQTLDLCPSHRDDMGPFFLLVAEWGATAEAAPRTRRRAVSGPLRPEAATPQETAPAPTKNRRGGRRARARRAGSQGATTAPPGSFACPLCDATPASPSATSSHLRNVHDTTASEVYGTVCPVCNHTSATGRALGIHGSNVHHVAGVPGLFALATAEGDPHGVIASRAEAVGLAASR